MSHSVPAAGISCQSCWEDINGENLNYVEYQAAEGGPWLPGGFCKTCVQYLLQHQWRTYTDALAKTTCKAEQKRLLARGPPINLKDKTAMPCQEDGEGEVFALWFAEGDETHSAKLDGSLVGEARQKYWDEQLAFQFDEPDEKSEVEAAPVPLSPQHPLSPPHSPHPVQSYGQSPVQSPIKSPGQPLIL